MKIIFMGTPEFAVASLAALVNMGEIIGVVTQPDRPKGRGHKMQSPPVKLFAPEHYSFTGNQHENNLYGNARIRSGELSRVGEYG